jgi:putative peptide zinc metalloprotease protein
MSTTTPPPQTTPPAAEQPPRLAEGVELAGEYKDSGFKTPPWIVRRADGQVVQLPRMLYMVAEQADGARSVDEIAERVTEASGRGVDGDAIRLLVDKQLRPLGVLAGPDGESRQVEKVDPLLALKFRTAVVPAPLTRAVTTVFRPLFLAPIVLTVVAGLIGLDVWLFAVHGISQSLRAVIYQPALMFMLFGGVALSTAFHEIGHASALRYGGGRPGVMGMGIYVVWPAFYTDVTDAYRLSKVGRLRTDLGGVYFNGIFALTTAGLYALTGFEPLLLLVLLQNFAILQQLLPLLRLDGHYILSDLTGVPDMLTRIKPVLQSLIPGREPSEKVTQLKPWVRVVVTAYVLTIVPVLLFSFLLMLLHAPRAFATAYDSFGVQLDKLTGASGILGGAGAALQLAVLVLPCAGIALTTGRVGSRAAKGAWGWSEGQPARRVAVTAAGAALLGLAAFTWWPNGDYRPIQPGERGTILGAVKSLQAVPSGRPGLTPERERELGGAPFQRTRRAEDARTGQRERGATSGDSAPDSDGPATGEATPTPTTTPTATPTPGALATATATPTPTTTPTPTPAATATPTPAATATATPTP